MVERMDALCDLLLGAAYADAHFDEREKSAIRELLHRLSSDAELRTHLDERINAFDPASFDLSATAARFSEDTEENKQRVIELVAAIHDADDVLDFAEDDYIRALAGHLALPGDAIKDLAISYEEVELQEHLAKLKQPPPPPQPKS